MQEEAVSRRKKHDQIMDIENLKKAYEKAKKRKVWKSEKEIWQQAANSLRK